MSLRCEQRYGQYLRVKNDRGTLEEWFVRPSSNVAYIQSCVNVASSYSEALSVLSKVGMRSVYFPDEKNGYRI